MKVKEAFLEEAGRNSTPPWMQPEIIMGQTEYEFRQCVRQLARRMTYREIIKIVDEELPE